MTALADRLGVGLPVVAAPMAGGPGSPALAVAAGRAGTMGFVAGGYLSAAALAADIATVAAAVVPFGVNLFAPNPVPIDETTYRRYADLIASEATRLGADLPPRPATDDDDGWRAKIDILRERPVPLVTFTFGLPPPADAALLRRAGTMLAQTVTSVAEARASAEAGMDALVVQAAGAGGHSATFTPERPVPDRPLADLVTEIRSAVPTLPILAAGGVGTAADVTAALHAGAALVAVGTALLRSPEAGTAATHRAALADRARTAEYGAASGDSARTAPPSRSPEAGTRATRHGRVADPAGTATVVTRAFTGRPARALRNEFTDRYSDAAPLGYPAVHTLTRPLRRAAAAAGDPERLHLWAGTGFRHATEASAAAILTRLSASA